MRLARFIERNRDAILRDWESFTRRSGGEPDEHDARSLHDYAAAVLDLAVDTLASPGKRVEASGIDVSAKLGAHELTQAIRRLRASALRLWGEEALRMRPDEVLRFNDTLDRAMSEVVREHLGKATPPQHMLDSLLSSSPDQAAVFDRNGRILYANPALAKTCGRSAKELVGASLDSLGPSFAAEVQRQLAHVLATGTENRGDFTINAENGEVRVIDYLFRPLWDAEDEIEAVAVNARDITAQRRLEGTLWMYGNRDYLTGVPNRRLFLDRLDQDIRLVRRSGGMLAVLYLDLDRFKEANDRLGQAAGDVLLRQAAERIQACTRETDTVARMGSDEFGVALVESGNRLHVEAVARAILARLSRPFQVEGKSVEIGGSIGIAVYPDHGESVRELVARADAAMHMAKRLGGDEFRFHGTREDAQARSGGENVSSIHRPH